MVTLDLSVRPFVEVDIDTVVCFGESLTVFGTTYVNSGIFVDTLITPYGCDSSLSLKLTVLPQYRDTTVATTCDNVPYAFADSTYMTAGTFVKTYTSTGGCDSTQTLILSVNPTLATAIDTTICAGESFTVGSEVFTTSGSYVRTIPASTGCDSVVSLSLAVDVRDTTRISSHVCANEVYHFGKQRLTDAGVYYRTLRNRYDCDSTVELTLRVAPRYDTEIRVELCDGEIYRNGGYNFAAAGRWPMQFYTADGCDSTVYVTLVYRKHVTTRLAQTICRGDFVQVVDTAFATAGTFTRMTTNRFGCDSTVILDLTIVDPTRTVFAQQICEGEVFRAAGRSFVRTTLDSFVLADRFGCDSTVVVDLEVLPARHVDTTVVLCFGESLTSGGVTYTESGSYVTTLPDVNGCDSTWSLELTVLPQATEQVEVTVCAGDTAVVNRMDYSEAGTFTQSLTSVSGCDSTLTLVVVLLDTARTELTASICAGESYLFAGRRLNTAGTYEQELQTSTGCDSTVVLTLSVRPVFAIRLDTTVCRGELVSFGSRTLAVPGLYVDSLRSVDGCDSVVELSLQHFAPLATADTVHLCEGDGREIDGVWRNDTGRYPTTYAGQNGCDSVHTTYLVVHPNVTRYDTARICHSDSVVLGDRVLRESGTYVAELVTALGCDSTVILELIVTDGVLLAADDAEICSGSAVTLQARGYNGPVTWSPAEGLSCTNCPNPLARPTTTTTYTVSALDCSGTVITATSRVRVRQPVDVAIVSKKKLRLGESTTLRAVASDPQANLQWREGSKVLCDACDEIEVRPLVTTVYEVQATTGQGCDDTERLTLIVEDACSFADIEIPNIITPNNDGANDLLEIRYAGLKDIVLLRIYNRWGEMVYETRDIDVFWDGTHRGIPLNPGVFMYYLEGHCLNEEPFTEEGNVTLIR